MEFEDGSISTYSENSIVEIMYAQCDEELQQYLLFGSILDHKTYGHALLVADQDVVVCGRSSKRKTTKGCHLCVEWKDRTTTWERLLDLNKSDPIRVAEYSTQGISHEPAFNWWVTLCLRNKKQLSQSLRVQHHV